MSNPFKDEGVRGERGRWGGGNTGNGGMKQQGGTPSEMTGTKAKMKTEAFCDRLLVRASFLCRFRYTFMPYPAISLHLTTRCCFLFCERFHPLFWMHTTVFVDAWVAGNMYTFGFPSGIIR